MKTQINFSYSSKPENKKLLQLFIDDELWKEIDRKSITPYLSDLKKTITLQEFQEKYHEIEKKMAKEEAFKILSYKGRFKKELGEKLRFKNFTPTAIDFAVQECIRLGFIDDMEEGKKQVRHYLSLGYGPKVIAMHLKMQCPAHQDLLLSLAYDQQEETIKKVFFKLCKNSNLKNTKEKQKVMRALLRRGFEFDLIERMLTSCENRNCRDQP